MMTPLAPRTPYTAVAEASLSTLTFSTSFGSSMLKAVMSRTMPSMTISGFWSPAYVPTPRTRIVDSSKPASPAIPAIRPTRALEILVTGERISSLPDSCPMAPVTVSFFWVPKPTTTTSSMLWTFSSSTMRISV